MSTDAQNIEDISLPTVTAPTAAGMRALTYNRYLLVLGFVGLFISGYLSLAKLMGATPACGVNGGGCASVLTSPASHLGPVPVAFIGFGGYLALTALAHLRSAKGLAQTRSLVTVGLLISGVGTLVSLMLQFYSIFMLHEICKWCLASALTMIATVILHALLSQRLDDGVGNVQPTHLDRLLPSGLAAALLLSLAVGGITLNGAESSTGSVVSKEKLAKVTLIPDKPNVFGEATAPVTVVEFADLLCPSCQENSPKLKEFARQHPGKIRVVFRHFPLARHKLAGLAAAMSEFAAEKGKFWDFTLAVMATHKEIEDPAELMTIAQSVNLDTTDMQKRLENENDPVYQRLTRDKTAADVIGINATPTFFVQSAGTETQAFGGKALFEYFKTPAMAKLISGS